MALSNVDQYYDFTPWDGLTLNERDWYVPDMMQTYRQKSVYRQYVPHQVDLKAQRTQKMFFNIKLNPDVNVTPLGNRQLWVDPLYADSAQLEVTCERHGSKVQLHKFEDYITYWKDNGRAGLAAIVRDLLAPDMQAKLDRLARDAFLQTHYTSIAQDPTKSTWNDIVDGDVFDLGWVEALNLEFASLGAPGFDGTPGSMVALVSPGAIYAIKNAAGNEWTATRKYTEAGYATLVNGEVGMWRGTRFVPTYDAILWNAGKITKQNTITVALNEGDGAVATYKGRTIGQGGATHTVTLGGVAFIAGDYKKGDIVTIHTARTNVHGVTNGVDPFHGKTQQRLVADVDVVNQTISFSTPIMENYTTDLGAGVYGYITKGRNVHTSTFITQPGAVIAGLIQAPEFHYPAAFDDFESIYRFSWDAWVKYQPFRDELSRVVFHAGQHNTGSGVTF